MDISYFKGAEMNKVKEKFNVVVIYGINHKGSTYNIVQELLKNFKNPTVTEVFLTSDKIQFCNGCYSCIFKGEEKCPHYESLKPIIASMLESKLIILASPCYVYDVTGQMKAFLDHLAYLWMPHRPDERMFKKIGVVISTAAGGGAKNTNKTMKKTLNFMGVSKVFSYSANVAACSWQGIKDEKKEKIEKDISSLSEKVEKLIGKGDKLGTSLFVKFIFTLMRGAHKKDKGDSKDRIHWEEEGWLHSKRPW